MKRKWLVDYEFLFYGSIIYTENQIQKESLSKRESLEYRPVSRVFLSLARFWRHRETTLWMNRVRCMLSMRGMLLVIEPSPYTRVLSTAGSVMTISLSINKMLALGKKKRQFEGRKQDWLVQKFVLRRPQRFNVIQAEPLFLFLNQQVSAQRVLE